MTTYPPRGLIGALVTPLNDDHRIDKPSLKSLLEYIMKHLQGVVIGSGDVGEGFLIDNERRMELTTESMKIADGRIPLFLSITEDIEDQTVENIIYVEKTRKKLNYRGDIFLLDCPLHYHGNKGLPCLYVEFGKLTSLPFVLYNNPLLITQLQKHLKRKNIRTNVLKKLSRNEQIVGIVHVGELRRAINYGRAVRERRNFRVYDGSELNFLSRPGLGGVVSQGANILPAKWSEVTESSTNPKEALREDPEYYPRIWKTGHELKLFHEAYMQNPSAIIKSALKLMGKIQSSAVFEGTLRITPKQESMIHDLLIEHGLLQSPNV